MPEPLLPWNAPENGSHPKLVWRGTLDNRYLIEVQRISDRDAELCVFDHEKGDKEIARWQVDLSYGARFGPDAADVSEWQEKVLDLIDNHYQNQQ